MQDLKALCRQGARNVCNAGHIAAGTAKRFDETELYGITTASEYDWNVGSCRLSRKSGRIATRGDDYGDFAFDELRCQRGQAVEATLGPAVFDRDIFAVDVAAILEALAERFDQMRALIGRAAVQKTDEGNGALG